MAGTPAALSGSAKRGFKLFIGKARCDGCHKGPNFSDDEFHALGLPQTGAHLPATDLGRFADVPPLLASAFNTSGGYSDDVATGKLTGLAQTAALTGQFRTKSLRGLVASAPYGHSGQFATLEAVVDFYNVGGGAVADGGTLDGKIGPLSLTVAEKADLAAFLKTLDGAAVDPALLVDTSR